MFVAQMYTMMRCEVCATRTFILWALRSEQQLYAATYALTHWRWWSCRLLCFSSLFFFNRANRNFVLLLLEVPLPIMVMTTHELTINDYLFMRVPVRV